MTDIKHKKNYGTSKRIEPYRVVSDKKWPRTRASVHNARYYEKRNDALLAYVISLLNQLFGRTDVERISFDRRDDDADTYLSMFESFHHPDVDITSEPADED